MNLKLVIFWIFGIILFAGLGLFGYLNRDLVLTDPIGEYDPSEKETNTTTCNLILEKGQSSYKFQVTNGNIDKYSISYTASGEDVDLYTAASNINLVLGDTQNPVNGLTSVLYGEVSSFTLLINVTIDNYDKLKVEEQYENLIKLNMVIDDTKALEEFKGAINGLGNQYTCN